MLLNGKNRQMRSLVLCSASAIALFGVSQAYAQDAAGQANSADSGSSVAGTNGLDIVVTATRRAEASRDVPVAVSTISRQNMDLFNSSGADIRFLSGRVPSLNIETSYGRTLPRFYIRGLGNSDFDANSAQPVLVVFDDVPIDNAALRSFPIFDVASTEVLRGPQGTLFGRNTPAGVVKFDTARPSDTFKGYGSVEAGSLGTVNGEAAVGGPLGGGFTFRLSGILQRRDNWIKNTSTTGIAPQNLGGYRDMAGRFQLGYSSGDFSALLNVHGRDLEGVASVYRAGIIQRGSNDFVSGFKQDRVALDGPADFYAKQYGANLHLDYKLSDIVSLSSISSYERANTFTQADIDGGNTYATPPLGLNVGKFYNDTGGLVKPREISQELRAVANGDGWNLQGGLYYFHQKLYYNEDVYDTAGTTAQQRVTHDDTNINYGAYISGQYKLTSKLSLRAGVRYSWDRKHDIVGGRSTSLTPGVVLPISTRVKGNSPSWDASLTYAVTSNTNLYARAAYGYLGPAIQDRVTNGSRPVTAKKYTTISGEAGVKTSLLDGHLRLDVDGFWMRIKNLQLTAVGGQTNTAFLINVDHALSYGVEADLTVTPVRNLFLSVNGSYNHTEIRDPLAAVGVCGSGVCTVTNPLNAQGRAILDGNPLPQAPRWIGNINAHYDLPISGGNVLFASADYSYRGPVNLKLYSSKEFRGKELDTLGLKVGIRTEGKFEAAVFVRNVTNEVRMVGGPDFNNLEGYISEPRIIGVSLKKTF
jgi:iron complex outermembrane recepter protein